MSLNLMDIFRKDYQKGYFSRNKKIFIISIILLLLFAFIGYLAYDEINVYELDEEYEKEIEGRLVSEDEDNFGLIVDDNITNALFKDYSISGFSELFFHNLSIDLLCIVGGLFLSIPTLITSFINGAMFGAIFAESPLYLVLFGVLPHGIFEIPSSLFALAGGLMLTNVELKLVKGLFSRKYTVKEKYHESAPLIKDAILSAFIVFILLFIAAFIETFITPVLLYLVI